PPLRYMEEPINAGPCEGQVCEKEEFDVMLDRFYQLHGWDQNTGLQTRDCLKELDLQDVLEKIEAVGKGVG
ncbi:MAG: aldehyde ferredoxin oxidoreductase, partial [Deltaproteobacteria bacterium]|nr:aldehyde ferredoxin oxidoreductase [Deltaproteobacteria bacterium]